MQEHIYSPKKIYYRTNEFKPGRQTLVFVHGITGSSAAWLPYEKKFEQSCNVLTFDLRGHGKSWKLKKFKDYEIVRFADDLHELILYLKIDQFVLISHSFGTLVAFSFMAKYLNLIKKAVLISPSYAPHKIAMSGFIRLLLKFVQILELLPFNQAGRGHVDYAKFKNSGDWNILRTIADTSKTSWRVFLYGIRHSYDVDFEKLLAKINIPVLILHGEKDSIFPVSHSVFIHKNIKNSQLSILEDSNHILVLNNFSEVSDAMEEFI